MEEKEKKKIALTGLFPNSLQLKMLEENIRHFV